MTDAMSTALAATATTTTASARLSVTECKARLATTGWQFESKVGPEYRFRKLPARGRAPKNKFAALRLADLRAAAQVPEMPKAKTLFAF